MQSQSTKIILAVFATTIIVGGGVYLWQNKQVSEATAIVDSVHFINTHSGAVSYNCKLSAGKFENGRCTCSLEAGQTQADMYDAATGFCQSTMGGPAGDAFNASIGLPYGSYTFFNTIIMNLCVKSGGTMSGASCMCPAKKTYSETAGECK